MSATQLMMDDGILDTEDNCPLTANADSIRHMMGDGTGDVC